MWSLGWRGANSETDLKIGRFFLWEVDMFKGRCPKCGKWYYGWALCQQRNQSCTNCGVGLLITDDGKTFFKGYSPFDADKYSIDVPKTKDLTESTRDDLPQDY